MFKKFLEKKGISADKFKELEAEKQMDLQNEYLGEIENQVGKTASKEELESAQKEIKDLFTESEKNLKDKLKLVDESVSSLEEKVKKFNVPYNENPETEMLKAIAEKHNEIKDVFAKGSGVLEFTMKAPALITTANGTNINVPDINGVQQTGLDNVHLRRMNIMNYVTTLPTSLPSYPYTEALPKDGDFDFVAEGGIKPQIDFTWETRYATPNKIAAWEKVTEEAVADVKGFMGVARGYLKDKHDLKKNKALLFGTGVGQQPKGATIYGKVFAAGALAASVQSPNFADVVKAGIVKISTTHNYVDEVPYKANLVLLNPIDYFIHIESAKDSQGRPLYPNGLNIPGITIDTDESIPVGKIFVGDMSKYNVTNYLEYTVKIGWVNDDFIKNQFVILGESRFHAFVKRLDEVAFIYDDIATIKTAITKP